MEKFLLLPFSACVCVGVRALGGRGGSSDRLTVCCGRPSRSWLVHSRLATPQVIVSAREKRRLVVSRPPAELIAVWWRDRICPSHDGGARQAPEDVCSLISLHLLKYLTSIAVSSLFVSDKRVACHSGGGSEGDTAPSGDIAVVRPSRHSSVASRSASIGSASSLMHQVPFTPCFNRTARVRRLSETETQTNAALRMPRTIRLLAVISSRDWSHAPPATCPRSTSIRRAPSAGGGSPQGGGAARIRATSDVMLVQCGPAGRRTTNGPVGRRGCVGSFRPARRRSWATAGIRHDTHQYLTWPWRSWNPARCPPPEFRGCWPGSGRRWQFDRRWFRRTSLFAAVPVMLSPRPDSQ